MDYIQPKTVKIIKDIFAKNFAKEEYRIIKIHGGQYQEKGLPDIMILTNIKDKEPLKFWIELKRNWKDKPSMLQMHNIKNLRKFGFVTGYCVGPEFKEKWSHFHIDFETYIKAIIEEDLF